MLILRKLSNVFFFIRKLKHFGVSQGILEMVYRSLIESILAFNIVTWFGVLTVRNKARLSRVVNTASKVIGCSQIPLSDVYANNVYLSQVMYIGKIPTEERPDITVMVDWA